MSVRYGISLSWEEIESTARILTNQFSSENERKKRRNCVFLKQINPEDFEVDNRFDHLLENSIFKKMLLEIVQFGINQYRQNYAERYKDTNLKLYQKYTYEDVSRLLNWSYNGSSVMSGYKYDSATKTLPVFINYDKDEGAIDYEDRFVSSSHLIALSKADRSIDSKDVNHIYKLTKEDENNRIYLFVRKNKDDKEAQEFYFLGEIEAVGSPKAVKIKSSGKKAFEIDYSLDCVVREDLYEYITEG